MKTTTTNAFFSNSEKLLFFTMAVLMASIASSYLPLLQNSWFLSWTIFSTSGLRTEFVVVVDLVSCVFVSSVMMIAWRVWDFSKSYMFGSPHFWRFHFLYLSFVGSMILLIVSPNLVSIILGWDGLGVSSYLLVSFYQNAKSVNAALITMFINRLGDVLLLFSMSLQAFSGSWNMTNILSGTGYGDGFLLLSLVLAASTKSAQVPFSAWLPAAMAAPTPVSALVHSSTLVTAGVYLLIRLGPNLAPAAVGTLCMWLGSATMFLAGVSALAETDMKKIVALSTLSQLGLMFFSLGLGGATMTFFHLISHAFTKAFLFILMGYFIHMASDFQDMRKLGIMGSGENKLVFFMSVSCFSLCGYPFMVVYYSKETIVELLIGGSISGLGWVGLLLGSLTLTMTYSVRLFLAVFFSHNRGVVFFQALSDSLSSKSVHHSTLYFFMMINFLSYSIFSVLSPPLLGSALPLSVKLSVMTLILLGLGFGWVIWLVSPGGGALSWSWGSMWGLSLSSSGYPQLFLKKVSLIFREEADLSLFPGSALTFSKVLELTRSAMPPQQMSYTRILMLSMAAFLVLVAV